MLQSAGLDIGERLKTQAQLRQLQADFTHAARISTLGELATSIAHEVKQPLSAIVTSAAALPKGALLPSAAGVQASSNPAARPHAHGPELRERSVI